MDKGNSLPLADLRKTIQTMNTLKEKHSKNDVKPKPKKTSKKHVSNPVLKKKYNLCYDKIVKLECKRYFDILKKCIFPKNCLNQVVSNNNGKPKQGDKIIDNIIEERNICNSPIIFKKQLSFSKNLVSVLIRPNQKTKLELSKCYIYSNECIEPVFEIYSLIQAEYIPPLQLQNEESDTLVRRNNSSLQNTQSNQVYEEHNGESFEFHYEDSSSNRTESINFDNSVNNESDSFNEEINDSNVLTMNECQENNDGNEYHNEEEEFASSDDKQRSYVITDQKNNFNSNDSFERIEKEVMEQVSKEQKASRFRSSDSCDDISISSDEDSIPSNIGKANNDEVLDFIESGDGINQKNDQSHDINSNEFLSNESFEEIRENADFNENSFEIISQSNTAPPKSTFEPIEMDFENASEDIITEAGSSKIETPNEFSDISIPIGDDVIDFDNGYQDNTNDQHDYSTESYDSLELKPESSLQSSKRRKHEIALEAKVSLFLDFEPIRKTPPKPIVKAPKSDSEFRSFVRKFLTPNVFRSVQESKKSHQEYSPVYIPDAMNRPWKFPSDFWDLVVDYINESLEERDLDELYYEQFLDDIEEFFNEPRKPDQQIAETVVQCKFKQIETLVLYTYEISNDILQNCLKSCIY